MIKVSDSVLEWLAEKLNESDTSQNSAFCLRPGDNGFELLVDDLDSEDETFSWKGREVMAVDKGVVSAMDGCTVDIRRSEGQVELLIIPPNASD